MDKQPVVARCIVEILGAPPEFITKKLQEHVDKVKQDGLDIQVERYAEPVPADKLFSQFVELQIAFKDVEELLGFCFDTMPSTVEIMSPEKIELDMAHFELFVNDIQAKLHQTDMLLKNMEAQKKVLDFNAINILHNFIKFACKTPRSLDDLSAFMGMDSSALSSFVENLVSKGVLKKEGDLLVTNG